MWVGLGVVFLVVYSMFQPSGAQEMPSWFFTGFIPLLFLGLFFFFLVRQRSAFKVNNDALAQLAEGRVLEALAAFEKAKTQMRNPLPIMNIGYSQLLLWRVHDAVANLETFARKAGSLAGVPGGERLAAPSAALGHALLGNTSQAKKWIAQSPGPAMAKLAEIVLACRSGDFAEASRLLQANEVILDQLGGVMRALAETLSAYVASKTGGRGGNVDPLRMFRESSADAFKTVWPELHDFIQRATSGPAQHLASP